MDSFPTIPIGARVTWCDGGRRTCYGTVISGTAHTLLVRPTRGVDVRFRRSRVGGDFECRAVTAAESRALDWRAACPSLRHLSVHFGFPAEETDTKARLRFPAAALPLSAEFVEELRLELDALASWVAARPDGPGAP